MRKMDAISKWFILLKINNKAVETLTKRHERVKVSAFVDEDR